MATSLFEARHVSKAFAAPVLKAVDLAIRAGELVALTGENGAGKSTLAKIVAGIESADSGDLRLSGEPYAPRDRAAAERAGVRMVLQELNLIDTLSVAENLLLGSIPARAGFIRRDELMRMARTHLERVGLTGIDPARPVSELGIGQQQLVEIARGLMGSARLLILDEPTATLSAHEISELFAQIEALKARGVGILYISHRLDELRRIADRVIVLRDGEQAADFPTGAVPHDELVRAMTGHAPAERSDRSRRKPGPERIRVEQLSRGSQVSDVSLTVYAGEIVGIAGLVGAGRTELLRLIFGADREDSGDIFLDGASTPTLIHSPAHAVAHGIGLLAEDRKTQGLLLSQSLRTNLTIADLAKVSRSGWIRSETESAAAQSWMQRLRIRARTGEQLVNELSGGNQQKVLLGRWLHKDCRILLLDEPTRGIDIGAREDIYTVLDTLAAAGKAILVASSDLRELTDLCDRIAVMSAGRLVQTFERGEWTEQAILNAAFSAFEGAAARGTGAAPV